MKISSILAFGAIASQIIGYTASAAPAYTNTWSNTAGAGVVKNWNDAANWTVGYAGDTPAPSRAVPTGSFVKMQRNAFITMADGDDYSVGPTYFAAGQSGINLTFAIPTGAKLSLDGVNETSYLGTSTWYDGGVNNKAKIDINGGELVCGQKCLPLRPNMTDTTSTGYSWIQIRNGGKLSLTNGYIRMYGGSSSDSQGRGMRGDFMKVG